MMQETAFEASQKYKEGKYIVEKARVMKVCWAVACFFILWPETAS
jgi:hypothetical protein